MRGTLVVGVVLVSACGSMSPPLTVSPPVRVEAPEPDVAAALAREGELEGAECERLWSTSAVREDAVLRGDVAVRCGRDPEALSAYEEAWAAGAHTCALALAISHLRERNGDVAGARAVLRSVGCREGSVRSARMDITGDPAEAEQTIASLLRRDPNDAEALSLLVALHVARGQPDAAEGVCGRAEAIDDARLWHACARAALESGRLDDAEACYRRAVAGDSMSAAHLELGELLLRERRSTEAADVFRSALDLDAGSYEATVGLARALRLQGCMTSAEHAFDRAVAHAPQRPEAYWYRATYGISPEGMFGDAELMRNYLALERFVELAGDDPRFRNQVEEVIRSCPRSRARPRRGHRAFSVCRPGLRDRIVMMGGSTQMAEILRQVERQQHDYVQIEAGRCELP